MVDIIDDTREVGVGLPTESSKRGLVLGVLAVVAIGGTLIAKAK